VISGRREDSSATLYSVFLLSLSWLFNWIVQLRLWL
jgi:hypothetical protein